MFHNSRRIFLGIVVEYKMNQNVVIIISPNQFLLVTELSPCFSCKHFFLVNGSANCIAIVHDAVRYN